MKLKNFHSHTSFSDGQNTPEEMVKAAIASGLTDFGISDHSFTGFDPDYCMAYESYEDYKKEVFRLKELYKDSIRLYLGIEQDYYSDHPAEGFDYVIGSVHYVKVGDEFITVDWGGEEGAKILLSAADRFFKGDIYSLIELYFETVSDVVNRTGADIIGHFDVICKSNAVYPFFDPTNPRYIASWKKAVNSLITYGKIFEINVSPLFSGNSPEPYPSKEIQNYIASKGGRFLYSGDSHSADRLAKFAEFLKANR